MQAHTLLLSLAVLSPLAGCAEVADDSAPLLFGLTDADVQQLHDAYLADEPIAVTRAHLAAPFDCAQYDDLCEQVGSEVALAITERQVELALSGAAIVDIEQVVADGIAASPQSPPTTVGARSAGPWVYDVDSTSTFRMAVRNGITTPFIGHRTAWTEAYMQHKSGSSWADFKANLLCVDTGANTQIETIFTSSTGPIETLIESFNPGPLCEDDDSHVKKETTHQRNNGSEGNGIQTWYEVTARGSAWGTVASESFGHTIAPPHTNYY